MNGRLHAGCFVYSHRMNWYLPSCSCQSAWWRGDWRYIMINGDEWVTHRERTRGDYFGWHDQGIVAFSDPVWLTDKWRTFFSSSLWRLKIVICGSPFLLFKAFPSQLFLLFKHTNHYVHVLKFLKGRRTNINDLKDFKSQPSNLKLGMIHTHLFTFGCLELIFFSILVCGIFIGFSSSFPCLFG